MSTALIEFPVDGGQATVAFAVPDTDPGVRRVARGPGDLIPGPMHLEAALSTVRTTAEAVLAQVRTLDLLPEVEVEFGIQMTARVGAVIASGEAGGHLRVKLRWQATT
jgi:NTP-dependent ternary system trypsin peptidase co-occuring protein